MNAMKTVRAVAASVLVAMVTCCVALDRPPTPSGTTRTQATQGALWGCDEPSTGQPSAAASRGPRTLKALLEISDEILIGTMTGTGPQLFDTPDGHEPTADDGLLPWVGHRIEIDIERMLRGDAADAESVVEYGGPVGCAIASPEDSIALHPGERSVFFLLAFSGFANPGLVGSRGVIESWPIDADGTVQSDGAGTFQLDDLVARILREP